MLNTTLPTKSDVETAYKYVHTRDYPADWALTDTEYRRILDAAIRYGKPLDVIGECGLSGLEVVVDEFFIDDSTFRILTEGYVLFNGEAHFASEDDAVEWLNANGCDCSDWAEAHELSEAEKIDYCYWIEWALPFSR